MCACSPEGQPSPGLCQKNCDQQVEGRDSAALLRSGETPPGSPASSSGVLSTEQTWSCWNRARESPRNDARAGTPLLGGKAGRAGAVQPGEEKALGRPQSTLSVPEGAYKEGGERLFTRAHSDRTRGNGFKLKEG